MNYRINVNGSGRPIPTSPVSLESGARKAKQENSYVAALKKEIITVRAGPQLGHRSPRIRSGRRVNIVVNDWNGWQRFEHQENWLSILEMICNDGPESFFTILTEIQYLGLPLVHCYVWQLKPKTLKMSQLQDQLHAMIPFKTHSYASWKHWDLLKCV